MRFSTGVVVAALTLGGCATPAPGAQERISGLPAWFNCLRESGDAIVGAHRGGYLPGYPENAVETVLATAAAMPALAEVDVAAAADGFVILHDDTLERTTTGAGPIASTRVADFQALRLEDASGTETAFRGPSLRQMLDAARGKIVLQLDIKRGVDPAALVNEVREAGAIERVIFITYTLDQAIVLGRLAPEAMLSVSIQSPVDLETLAQNGVDLDHVLAWTGTRPPAPGLWPSLRKRNIEPIFGTLGREGIDRQIAESGNTRIYSDLVSEGVAILASDRSREAYAALVAAGKDVGATRCGRPPVE
jgi:glycerophosphoryl diester phosphodiesterase